jgi:hypothetical protein
MANSDISEANIGFLARDSPSDTDHETDLERSYVSYYLPRWQQMYFPLFQLEDKQ